MVVEIPLAERPLAAMVAGEHEDNVFAKLFCGHLHYPSELAVQPRDVGVIPRAVFSGLGRVHEVWRQACILRLVDVVLGPRHVRAPVADQEAERAVRGTLFEKLRHVVCQPDTRSGIRVEAILRLGVSVRHFAERCNLIAQRVERFGEVGRAGMRVAVIRFCAVSCGHEAGQQGRAAGRTRRRCDEGVLERHSHRRKPLNVGRADVTRAVHARIPAAQIVGQEHDQIGRGVRG